MEYSNLSKINFKNSKNITIFIFCPLYALQICALYSPLSALRSHRSVVPHPGYGCIIALDSGTPPAMTQYQITVSSEPACTCPAFKQTMVKFGKKGGYFSYCKHIYYVFIKVCKRDPNVDLFMHAPTFSFNEIKLLLESGILTRSNS